MVKKTEENVPDVSYVYFLLKGKYNLYYGIYSIRIHRKLRAGSDS